MQCPDCQTVLSSKVQLEACPICGYVFSSSQNKPSFEKTWGLIYEEELRKHPSSKKFEEAWHWYKQDLELHPKDPRALRDAAWFLKKYGSYSSTSISFPSFIEDFQFPKSVQAYWPKTPWVAFFWMAMMAQDGSSGLQLYWLKDQELRHDLSLALQPLSQLNLEELSESSYDQIILYLLGSALKQDGIEARKAFKVLQKLNPEEKLVLMTPKAFELLSGVSTTLEDRLKDLQHSIKSEESMDLGLEFLYRPLTIAPVCFDHLNHLPEEYIAFLASHQEDWHQKTYAMIQADRALRGIHLALQTIQSQYPELESICQSLLEAQYIQAYLRPFEQIEKSDARF